MDFYDPFSLYMSDLYALHIYMHVCNEKYFYKVIRAGTSKNILRKKITFNLPKSFISFLQFSWKKRKDQTYKDLIAD